MSPKNDTPLITTVIPTFRRPTLLKRAIRSVLAQSFGRVRALVCDNASGDETAKVVADLAEQDPRVDYHCHASNVGPYRNFNFGIQHVRTPYFSLLSDDDVLAPHFYERAIAAFDRYPDVMFVGMSTMVVDDRGQVIGAPIPVQEEQYFPAGAAFLPMHNRSIPDTWTGMLCRTELRDLMGVIDVDAGPSADGGFVLHAAARFPYVIVPGVAAVLLGHPASASATMPPIDAGWLAWDERMISAIEMDPHVPEPVRQSARQVMARDYRRAGLSQAARWLAKGDEEAATRVAAGLAGCGHPIVSRLVATAVSLHRWCPPARVALRSIRDARQRRLTRERAAIQARLKNEIAFLAELGA
jgi:glycosyltransferase involved in cell wall biosynthesis